MKAAWFALWLVGIVVHVLVAREIVRPYWRNHEALGWPETACTIARTWAPDDRDVTDRSDERVSYAYALGGQAYLGERIDFMGRRYPHMFDEGEVRPCWYDPADPSTSVLVRELWRVSDWILIGLYALLSVLIAFGLGRGAKGARAVGAASLRVLLVANLGALAWLARAGGASFAHAAGLTLVAAAACVWLAVTLRAPRRVPEARVRS